MWLRVSTGHQDADNQLPDVERFAAHHGYDDHQTLRRSASPPGTAASDGGEYRAHAAARAGRRASRASSRSLIVWALDRITREGAEGALRIIRQFRERGCTVVSVKESWLNGSPEVQDVLVAFAGWMAQQESARRSERIKAGLARRRAEGKPVGRQPGAADKGQRRRSGYVARWERERQQQDPAGRAVER